MSENRGNGVDSRVTHAAAVARVVELRNVRLRRLAAEIRVPADQLVGAALNLDLRRTASHVFLEPEKLLRVVVDFHVACSRARDGATQEAAAGPSGEAEEVLTLDVAFELDYTLSVDAPPADARPVLFGAFADLNGAFNAWPYFREVVQNTVLRMGIPPIVAPLYRLPVAPPPLPDSPGPSQTRAERAVRHRSDAVRKTRA